MTRYGWVLAVAALALLSFLSLRDWALGDAPDIGWRQEDPKFGVTQKYCLFTGNSMILSASRKAFDAVDGHFGGILNPVQFQEDCANLEWSYWVDQNSGDCGTDDLGRAFPGCATLWNQDPDGEHYHGNGGHIGIDTSYWIWDSQDAMDAAAGQELGHLWGLDHVTEGGPLGCDHPHPSAMSGLEGSGNHITANCTGADGLMPGDLNSLDPLYSSSNVPLFGHLVANGSNTSYGTFYWYADHIHEEAWFLIDHKEGAGDWFNETMWGERDTDEISDASITPLPERQPGVTTRQDCWRVKAWANWWSSDYGTVSCISRPGTAYPLDGTLTQFMGYGTSEIIGHNLSSETVVVKLYDGLLGLGDVTLLRTCNSVSPGGECTYSYSGRGPGGWHSIEMFRLGGEVSAWAVAVDGSGSEPPSLPRPTPSPTPTPAPTPTPCPPGGCPVGGIAGLPEVAGTPLEASDSSGRDHRVLTAVVAAITAVALALGGAAWYARRRWLR